MLLFLRILLPFCFLFGFFPGERTPQFDYDLNKPLYSVLLPDTLREISGHVILDSSTIACIQDENGIVFIYDLKKRKIRRYINFAGNGDYECITQVKDNLYVLRSDGLLFEIRNFKSRHFKVRSFITGIPSDNNEGLCYDAQNQRLLIASKSRVAVGPEYKDKRHIYAFDLATFKLSAAPVYVLDVREVKQFVIKQQINMPMRSAKKGMPAEPFIRYRISEISVHPVNGQLFLLSAADHLLLVYGKNGELADLQKLNPVTFNKPEGISFFENGDMLISNEGQKHRARLLRFNYVSGTGEN